MPYCPTHGFQPGKHCSQCGAPLSDSPPDAGDSVRVRSPEAHAHASANPTFVLPGGHVETRPALVKCPKCGKRNLEPATFDCQGDCGRENLCERHFDEEYEVCIDCAREWRGEAKAEAARQAQLQADLVSWRQRAEQAEATVHELTRQGEQGHQALEQARADLRQAQARVRSLEQEVVAQRRRAEQAEADAAALTQRSQQAETNLAQRTTDLGQSREQVRSLEKDLAGWRGRAEKAEGELAAIERARQEADATRGRTEEVSRPQSAVIQMQQREIDRLRAELGHVDQQRCSLEHELRTQRFLERARTLPSHNTE